MSERYRVRRGLGLEYFLNAARRGKIRGMAQSTTERTNRMSTTAPFSRRAIEDAVEGQPQNIRHAAYALVEQVESSRRKIEDLGVHIRRITGRTSENVELWFQGEAARINDLGELQSNGQQYDIEIAKYHVAMTALALLVPLQNRSQS